MTRAEQKLVVHVDGGARGNPGPAAIGVVVSRADGELRGVELASEHGAREVHVINDSELVARQLTGAYKVKHPAMRELHRQALAALGEFDRWSIESVPRAQNAQADALVNDALDR